VIVENGLSTVIADHVIGVDSSVAWSAALQWEIGTHLVRLANYIKSAGGLKLGYGSRKPLQLMPPHPSLHWQDVPSSRSRRWSPYASESHSVTLTVSNCPSESCVGKNARGTRQSMPPQPGGHLHCPSYGSQWPYCPQVNLGSIQLKHGGHLSGGEMVNAQSVSLP
jgi:hypothetical protein